MKLKSIKIAALAVASLIGIFTLNAAPVFSANSNDVCSSSASAEVKRAAGCSGTSQNGLFNVIQAILNTIISIAGIVAVIFIIVGGVQYMTSSGDAGKAKKAKDTILYAVIGLVVCALAFAIVNFVLATILKQ